MIPRSGVHHHGREAIGLPQGMLIGAEPAHRVTEQEDAIGIDVEAAFALQDDVDQVIVGLLQAPTAIRRLIRRRGAHGDHARGGEHVARAWPEELLRSGKLKVARAPVAKWSCRRHA